MATRAETRSRSSLIVRKLLARSPFYYLGEGVIWVLMLLLATYEMLPILWVFSTSLRLPADSFNLPPSFLPTSWHWKNYLDVLKAKNIAYGLFFYNSIKLAGLVTIGELLTCSMAGFAFARLRFRGRDAMFYVFLASMMVPGSVYVIPLFIIIRNLGLMDTHAAIILPALTGGLGVFLMRQYFLTLPSEMVDSAKIDGAGFFRIYWQVLLPHVGPGLSALGIFSFLGQWNNFFGPLLFLRNWRKMTLPIALVTLQGYMGSGSRAEICAAVVLSVVPVLVFFLFAQRYVVQGIALTGIKG
jgi:multiple sugar transport system permease protein